jgi:hypothetical protein
MEQQTGKYPMKFLFSDPPEKEESPNRSGGFTFNPIPPKKGSILIAKYIIFQKTRPPIIESRSKIGA